MTKQKTKPMQIGDIMSKRKQTSFSFENKKPPAYEWQELSLKIIDELNIPNNKKSSVFKLCKTKNKAIILNALADTKELCKTKEKWRYFFKVLTN